MAVPIPPSTLPRDARSGTPRIVSAVAPATAATGALGPGTRAPAAAGAGDLPHTPKLIVPGAAPQRSSVTPLRSTLRAWNATASLTAATSCPLWYPTTRALAVARDPGNTVSVQGAAFPCFAS